MTAFVDRVARTHCQHRKRMRAGAVPRVAPGMPNAATHLRYWTQGAPPGHPERVMRDLGITYADATPQSIADQWWFWHCTSVPDPLPSYLEPLGFSASDMVGYGLSTEQAERLEALDHAP